MNLKLFYSIITIIYIREVFITRRKLFIRIIHYVYQEEIALHIDNSCTVILLFFLNL